MPTWSRRCRHGWSAVIGAITSSEQYRFTLAPYRVQTAEYAARFSAVGALDLRHISNFSSTPEDAALSPEEAVPAAQAHARPAL